jgi:hypothetical protein
MKQNATSLDPFYGELARRFAGLGQPTLVIDPDTGEAAGPALTTMAS